ncbi:helix-turn-helix domain-containing protein [Sphingobium sp. AntQ-1]|uniref:helix-turn-helix domain-containing protein n=1 Tax=Sphingobium sp. AntQ-1 TaxID=2930091 RepID=UPI00234F2DD4|nr:helix-turn-helix domain-containing protein [Sphingobium sp. AntQ-1]
MEAGTFEEAFFAVPAKGETDRLLHVARKTLDAARRLRRDERAGAKELSAAERLIARLTSSAVRVYEEILTLARLNRGQVFPSYDHLADATGLGRATICRALTILEAIGFLARQRRFNRVEGQGPGPRYKQTSNAYRPLLPAKVLSYLPRWLRPAPVPEDEVQRRLDHIEDMQLMLKSLSCRELAEATIDGPLRKILAKLGDAIDRRERESQTGSEPLTDSYINRLKGVGLAGQRLNA